MKSTKIYLISLALALLVFGGYQYFAMGTYVDPDGFYHAKASQLLVHGELSNQFPWLQFSTWKDGYADQHYLYHWLLAPVNTIELLPLSIIFFGVFFTLLFTYLLKKLRVVWIPFWVIILLFGSVDFIFRTNVVKANVLSLILFWFIILILILWQKTKRYQYLLVLSILGIIFVWSYGGFVFVPVLVGMFCLSLSLYSKKIIYWPLIFTLVGLTLGLISHPHGFNILTLLFDQIIKTGLGAGSVVPAGAEWLPYQIEWFVKSNLLVLGLWTSSIWYVVSNFYRTKKWTWVTLWLHGFILLLLGLTIWHQRFIEYFVPFAIIASAISLSGYLAKVRMTQLVEILKSHWQLWISTVLALVVLMSSIGYNGKKISEYINSGTTNSKLQLAAESIKQQSQESEIVFNTQWDYFPPLFYWNHKNLYITGLDPTFTYINDPGQYWLWRKIADDDPEQFGSVESIYQVIKYDFHAGYLLIDKSLNVNLNKILEEAGTSELFFKLFEDEFTVVWGLRG